MPADSLRKFPEDVKENDRKLKVYQEYPGKLKRAVTGLAAWEKKYRRADTQTHRIPGAGSVWTPVEQVERYAGVPGALWFRNEFVLKTLPDSPRIAWIRQTNPITCFINGVRIGSHSAERAVMRESFSPKIPDNVLKVGKNEILYRVFSSHKTPVFASGIVVAGVMPDRQKWQVCVEFKLPEVTDAMRRELPEFPAYSAPSACRLGCHLYNGMIAPLRPATLSGVIWYQGENDQNIWKRYCLMMPEMITAWRKEFRNPELPFFYCQLPAIFDKQKDPAVCTVWTEMRQAQDSALTLPRTGGAVLVDAGEAHDIHYLDKRLPGERLAALALGEVYGKKGEYRSPRMSSCRLENGKVRIRFEHTGSGLVARPLPKEYPLTILGKKYAKLEPNLPGCALQGFALCGKDGKWYWAPAEIAGNEVILSCSATPVKVRYAWQDNPSCNLYNKEGFPAAPFQCEVK